MPTLADVVTAPDLSGLSDADCAAALAVPVELSRDTSPKNVRDIAYVLSPDQFSLVWGTLKAAAPTNALIDAHIETISSTGINFASDMTRGMVLALAAGTPWPDDVRDALLEMGIQHGPRWRKEGLGAAPSAADVTAARAALARVALNTAVAAALAFILNEYLPAHRDPATDAPTRATVAAELDSLLAAAGVP